MKKLVTILLTLAMVLSLSICAFADETETPVTPVTYEVTFNGIQGHTYEIYQVFVGDVAEEDGKFVLSNVKYGQNFGTEGDEVPAETLERIETSTDFADFMALTQFNGYYDKINVGGTANTATLTVPGGYYVIKDVTPESQMPDGQTDSLIILQVMGEVTITSKHATISSTKKTFDINDSTDLVTNETPVDAADYDIGDNVPFQLTVNLPTTMPSYKNNYNLTFHDKQADGLSIDTDSIKVYILKAGTGIKIPVGKSVDGAPGYSYTEGCAHDENAQNPCEFGGDCTFCITVTDLNSFYTGEYTYADGDQLIVEYESELTTNAVTGRNGNINGMYVCHPDGHTPVDYVIILTYELDITKVDGATGADLPGAEFELYKWIATEEGEDKWVLIDTVTLSEDLAMFTWAGLDGGKYKLVESDTPDGYNTLKPIEFEIDATHEDEWEYGTGEDAFVKVIAKTADGSVMIADQDLNGVLEGDIANHKGTILPETGAEGTFFLITTGTILVVLAAVFMITRKKMSIYED